MALRSEPLLFATVFLSLWESGAKSESSAHTWRGSVFVAKHLDNSGWPQPTFPVVASSLSRHPLTFSQTDVVLPLLRFCLHCALLVDLFKSVLHFWVQVKCYLSRKPSDDSFLLFVIAARRGHLFPQFLGQRPPLFDLCLFHNDMWRLFTQKKSIKIFIYPKVYHSHSEMT